MGGIVAEEKSGNGTDVSAESTTQPIDPTEQKINELQSQADRFKNEYLYLRAEFDNYKKHAIKERSDLAKFGHERLAVELLNVLDIFERALELKATPENISTFTKGIEMTSHELKSLLQKFGVQEIPSLGQAFNPAVHEALGAEESATHSEGHITKVFKKPYKLHDKVIRPGQVIVAKSPAEKK